jgi:hypothetical protein
LSQWLGSDLDYHKIQNLLVETDDDLKKGKYAESLVEQLYRLDDKDQRTKSFYLTPIIS